MIRTSNRPPRTVPILSINDFCQMTFNDDEQRLCLLGWFRKAFCHEHKATEAAAAENPINKCSKPVILSWVPVLHYGFSLRREYKNWRANALQTLIKECKKVDKHSRYPVFSKKEEYINPETIMAFNDDTGRRKETLAKIWNRTMASLGYVKGNPKAKR